MALAKIPTPAALIDTRLMTDNILRMQQQMNRLGVSFRPHVKTAKCLEVARRQMRAGAAAITVSTLKEAELFFAGGFDDILYAVGIVPARIDDVLALRRRGCVLKVILDSQAAARAIATRSRETGHAFDVLIEIDSDGHRAGVLPHEDRLLDIARIITEGGSHLAGVMTHAGGSYACNTPQALADFAEQERLAVVTAAQRLRDAGFAAPVVSLGSTPTALSARSLAGVTEVRAGVYVFFDLVMAGIGVCTPQQVALSVLTTVLGHQAERGWVIVDAGWMAMSRDRGTQAQQRDQGYGLVCNAQGVVLDDWIMVSANQEHGILARRDASVPADIESRFALGTQLRILPNHACATAAQFPEYQALMEDGTVQVWPRFYGW